MSTQREPTPAQARYRMRFSVHQVPDPAPKTSFISNRLWLGKAMAFAAVFSMLFTTIDPAGAVGGAVIDDQSAVEEQIVTTVDETTEEVTEVEEVPAEEASIIEETMPVEWQDNGKAQQTVEPVQLGVVYTAPQNKELTVIFTKLPETPGKLSIEEVSLTQEEQESIGSVSDKIYDITSEMENGSFEFDLTLPASNTEENIQVVYADDWENLAGAQLVESPLVVEGDAVKLTDLNHFTFFLTIFQPKIEVDDLCSYEPELFRTWEIKNNNNSSKTVNWQLYKNYITVLSFPVPTGGVEDSGSLTIPGNSTATLTTSIVSPHNVLKVTGGGLILPQIEVHDGEECGGPQAQLCGQNLVVNGDFEAPIVSTPQNWDIYQTGDAGLGWSVIWSWAPGGPAMANLELHRGVNGWLSQGGSNQHTELDSDWGGPASPQSGEEASTEIYQYLATTVGNTYEISFWTSPRPGVDSNHIRFFVNGVMMENIYEDGSSNSNTVWTERVHTFTATSGVTKIAFQEDSFSDSLGSFLDTVSVKEDCASDVTICKYNGNQQPLSGWDVFLSGGLVDTVEVDSDDTNGSDSDSLPAGDYIVKVSGDWENRINDENSDHFFDAEYHTTDNWGTNEQGEIGLGEDQGDLQVNESFVNWGAYSSAHEYSLNYTHGGGSVNFRVFEPQESWYGDNQGTMTVQIYSSLEENFGGITGENGCVTIEDVPFGTYTLDEVMQPGWTNQSGQGDTVEVDSETETFALYNTCGRECEEPTPQLHFIKVVCTEFGDIMGNEDGNMFDDTNDNYTLFSNYDEENETFDPLVGSPVNPNEIPTGENVNCERMDGWSFQLSSDIGQNSDMQIVGPTVGGEFVTPISGDGSVLSAALQAGIRGQDHNEDSKEFWVSEITQEGYQFAAIRCYDDALNGDNLEFIDIGDSNPGHIYCIAYNVGEIVEPCEAEPISLQSGLTTQFMGLKEGSAPTNLFDDTDYPNGVDGNAVLASPTGFPGAWDGPPSNPNLSGSIWVNNMADQPNNPADAGGNGTVDSWRLFSHTFTVPAGATNISSPTLYFAADNEVTVFLDNVQIGFNNSFAVGQSTGPLALTAGSTYTLEFAVKNWAFNGPDNPTGLIYKLDTITYECDGGGGDDDNTVQGLVYFDDNQNANQDEGEDPLPGMTVKLLSVSDDPESNELDETEAGSDVSDSNGRYQFDNVADGCYIVRELPAGYTQTEPTINPEHEYYIAVGGADCDFSPPLLSALSSLFIKTAQAAQDDDNFVAYFGTDLDFGNYNNDQGGSSGGSSSSGSRRNNNDNGSVLGDTTNLPYIAPTPTNNGSVLGASTTLPVTGTKLPSGWILVALMSVIILPASLIAKKMKTESIQD